MQAYSPNRGTLSRVSQNDTDIAHPSVPIRLVHCLCSASKNPTDFQTRKSTHYPYLPRSSVSLTRHLAKALGECPVRSRPSLWPFLV